MSSHVNYAQYSAHYASIIPDAIIYLLCSKLCWHNWARPKTTPMPLDLGKPLTRKQTGYHLKWPKEGTASSVEVLK